MGDAVQRAGPRRAERHGLLSVVGVQVVVMVVEVVIKEVWEWWRGKGGLAAPARQVVLVPRASLAALFVLRVAGSACQFR